MHNVLRVHGQTLAQAQPHLRRHLREGAELRPGRLRIDEINGERRHTAPIVDAASNEQLVLLRRQIGWGLEVHLTPEDQPRHGNRAQKVEECRLGVGLHRDVRLGAKILDDHFLDVTIALLQLPYSTQGIDALAKRLADANENPGSKRDCNLPAFSMVFRRTAGSLSGALSCAMPGPSRRRLVVSSMMPMLGLTSRRRARSFGPMTPDWRGQQRCVVQDELAHLHQIVQRAAVSIALQLLAHGGKECLRFIAQAK